MKQLVFGTKAYKTALTDFSAGDIGVFYMKDGKLESTSVGSDVTSDEIYIVGRDSDQGNLIQIPIAKSQLSVNLAEYEAATTFKAVINIPDTSAIGEYSIAFVDKTADTGDLYPMNVSYYADKENTATDKVIGSLAKQIAAKSKYTGIQATSFGANSITVECLTEGRPFSIIVGDNFRDNATVAYDSTLIGSAGRNTYTQINALIRATQGGKGLRNTDDMTAQMYPGFPYSVEDMLASSTAVEFNVFNLAFTKHNMSRTTDEGIRQIVHIAVSVDDIKDKLTAVFDGWVNGESTTAPSGDAPAK